MTKQVQNKARSIDRKHFKKLWEEAKTLIKEHYLVKSEAQDEIFIQAKNNQDYDIEIYFNGGGLAVYYFSINLWNCSNKTVLNKVECSSLFELFIAIDSQLEEIKQLGKVN